MTDENINQICNIISKMNKPEEIKEFFNELFTESEIQDVIQRWNILKMLSENKPQRNIAKTLSVSLCKVTRGAKILKNEQSITRKILFDESWRR